MTAFIIENRRREKKMGDKLVSLRLRKEVEREVEKELEIMKAEQPWQCMTLALVVRSLIFDGLRYRKEKRARND